MRHCVGRWVEHAVGTTRPRRRSASWARSASTPTAARWRRWREAAAPAGDADPSPERRGQRRPAGAGDLGRRRARHWHSHAAVVRVAPSPRAAAADPADQRAARVSTGRRARDDRRRPVRGRARRPAWISWTSIPRPRWHVSTTRWPSGAAMRSPSSPTSRGRAPKRCASQELRLHASEATADGPAGAGHGRSGGERGRVADRRPSVARAAVAGAAAGLAPHGPPGRRAAQGERVPGATA